MSNPIGISEIEALPLSRRAFLAASGALVVTLAAPAERAGAAQNGAARRPPLTGDQLSSYLTIDADGTVVAYYGKIDGGQGLGTSIAQMVADEIDVPFEKVRAVMGDSGQTLDMGGASAAIGVSHGGMVLRRTAAQARHLLIELAAGALGLPADQLTVTDGVVHAVADETRGISYAALIGGRYFEQKVKWNGKTSNALGVETTVPLKTPGQFKVIGKSPRRRDLPGKVFGTLDLVN
ncbi:MAG TPA: molybdopterin cofactor-binding domain-containing protein, partial [Xanthobacteraceae bacterium]